MADPVALGAYLRGLRERAELTQQQLATVTGLGRSDISAYESGQKLPTDRALVRYLLGVKAEVGAAFEAVGRGHQRGVLELDQFERERGGLDEPRDPLRALNDVLVDGGWPGEARKALVTLAKLTMRGA